MRTNLPSLIYNEFMQTVENLRDIYPYDPRSRTFTIPTRLETCQDFFNPLDPSPAPARDLSPDLVEYLNQCSDEIPENHPLVISVEIRAEEPTAHQVDECLRSLGTFYKHEILVIRSHIRHQRARALRYLLVSCLCLALYLLSEQVDLILFPWSLLREAILIGGWVFMWEAVTLNFIEMDGLLREIRKYQRLLNARLDFHHLSPPTN